jgi:hypothetical protein
MKSSHGWTTVLVTDLPLTEYFFRKAGEAMPDNPFNQHFQDDINRRQKRRDEQMRQAQWDETVRVKTKAAKQRYTNLVSDVLCSLIETNYPHNHVVKTTGDFEHPGVIPRRSIARHAFDWSIIVPGYLYYRLLADTFWSEADLRRSKVDYRYSASRYMKAQDRVVIGVNLWFDEQMVPSMFLCYRANREAASTLTREGLVETLIRLHTATHRTRLVWQYDGMIARALMELWIQVGLDRRGRVKHPQIMDVYGEVFTSSSSRLGKWALEFAKPGGVGIYDYEPLVKVDLALDSHQNPLHFVVDPGGEAVPLNYSELARQLVKRHESTESFV